MKILYWKIPFTLLDAEGNVVNTSVVNCTMLNPLSLRDNRSMTKTTDWISTDYVYFSVPEGKDVATLRGELLAAEYSHPPNHIHDDSILQLGPVTIEPLGRVRDNKSDICSTIESTREVNEINTGRGREDRGSHGD